MEKEQELFKARNRVHELEALLSAKQQEVYHLYSDLYQPVLVGWRSFWLVPSSTG